MIGNVQLGCRGLFRGHKVVMGFGEYVFRVDSSKKIGSGHLMRCLTLAEGLRERGGRCTFVCRALAGNLNHIVQHRRFPLVQLPRPNEAFVPAGTNEPSHVKWLEIDWKTDAIETSEALSGNKIDWMIVDHYALWEEWQLQAGANAAKIMVIDDLGDRRHYCDLLLDQNFGSDVTLYRDLVPDGSRVFFGPKYALLRPEFAASRPLSLERRKESGLNSILLNFGGGDPDDFIARTLEGLLSTKLPREITVSVIFGNLASRDEKHQLLISKLPCKVVTYDSVENMAELLTNIDLVVGAAGSSSWERCCLGVPSVVIPVAVNQVKIARNLGAAGAAITLDPQDLENGEFTFVMEDLLSGRGLKMLSENASALCDGLGRDKIVNELRC